VTTTTLLLLTVGIVAWLTAAATAVRTVSRIWLRHWAEQQLSGAGAAHLYLDRPQRLLLAAGTGVALTVFAGGVILAFESSSSLPALLVEALSYALVLLVAGQLLPRAIARRWAANLIPILLPPLQLVELVLGPALRLVRRLTGNGGGEQPAPAPSEEEALEELLREGQLEGVGEAGEIAIISGVMQFAEKRARDVMTLRAEIFAVPDGLAPTELARRVAAAGYSRVPVYRENVDTIIGMVRTFDILKNGGTAMPQLRPVAIARPGMPCKELLSSMLRERRHLAIVREDGGPVVGLLTLEDLLEELVGDIRDEHDEPAPGPGAAAGTAAPTRSVATGAGSAEGRGTRPSRAAANSTA
jgi:putative hemolysin